MEGYSSGLRGIFAKDLDHIRWCVSSNLTLSVLFIFLLLNIKNGNMRRMVNLNLKLSKINKNLILPNTIIIYLKLFFNNLFK